MKKFINKEKKILEIITSIYICIIVLLFPLIVDSTGFFHILECKWRFFVIVTITCLFLCFIIFMFFLIVKKVNNFREIKFTKIHFVAFLFLLVCIISCLLSPFKKDYNLIIGVGRGEGLLVTSLYILSFLFVSLFGKFNKKYILLFSISSILFSSISILQFIGFNPLNMYQDGIGIHNVSFLGTIGNIDFVSAIYCIFLTMAAAAFIFLEDEPKYTKIIHLLSILMGYMMIAIIDVLSGKVATLAIVAIIFPFIILNNKRLSRFVCLIGTIILAYGINLFINPQYHYNDGRVSLHFNLSIYVLLLFGLAGIIIFLSHILYKSKYELKNTKKVVKSCYFIMIGIGFMGLIFLYFYKFKSGMLYEIHELLHGNFDDDFGTYRVFLWKRTLSIIPEYFVFGSGCDTFAIRFMARYTADVAALGELTINDTAANVYLTMFVNLGIVGLSTYLTFLFLQIKEGIKKCNKYSLVLLITLICYIIQDFFNLSVVIVSPLFWMVMALHFLSISDK